MYAAAALVALPFAMAALMYVLQTANQATFWRTLDHEEIVAGVRLPAGSRIHFADKAHTKVITIELPRVTEILGIRVAGPLARYDTWEEAGPVWSGPLAEDQVLNGIPCRAGYSQRRRRPASRSRLPMTGGWTTSAPAMARRSLFAAFR